MKEETRRNLFINSKNYDERVYLYLLWLNVSKTSRRDGSFLFISQIFIHGILRTLFIHKRKGALYVITRFITQFSTIKEMFPRNSFSVLRCRKYFANLMLQ